jgi:hypothetical protein
VPFVTEQIRSVGPFSPRHGGFAGRALDGLSPALEEIPVQTLFPVMFAFSQISSCHSKNTGYLGGRASGQSSSRRSCWLDQHFTHHG